MNFESFEDLVGEKNFDEIKIIGKDVRYMGEPSHFAAMVRKGDQAELCILMQKKRSAGARPEPTVQSSHQRAAESGFYERFHVVWPRSEKAADR